MSEEDFLISNLSEFCKGQLGPQNVKFSKNRKTLTFAPQKIRIIKNHF